MKVWACRCLNIRQFSVYSAPNWHLKVRTRLLPKPEPGASPRPSRVWICKHIYKYINTQFSMSIYRFLSCFKNLVSFSTGWSCHSRRLKTLSFNKPYFFFFQKEVKQGFEEKIAKGEIFKNTFSYLILLLYSNIPTLLLLLRACPFIYIHLSQQFLPL